ncbi:hypothetical protein C8R43DRAFT_1102073, partial [Mycena crocata]
MHTELLDLLRTNVCPTEEQIVLLQQILTFQPASTAHSGLSSDLAHLGPFPRRSSATSSFFARRTLPLDRNGALNRNMRRCCSRMFVAC